MDYIDAEETGDLQKMREISIQFGSTAKSTPRSSAPCEYSSEIKCNCVCIIPIIVYLLGKGKNVF